MSTPSPATPRPTRRTIARGAAWAVPVVAVGAAAPAFAASPPTALPAFSDSAGWTLTQSGTAASFQNGTFVLDGSQVPPEGHTATASHSYEVVAGVTYVFTLTYQSDQSFLYPVDAVVTLDGAVATGTLTTSSGPDSGTADFTVSATASGTVTFTITDSVGSNDGSGADSLTITSITVSTS